MLGFLLYPPALLLTILGLSLWLYFDGRNRIASWWRGLFSGSLVLYLLSLFSSGLSWEQLWPTLIRDLFLLAIIPSVLKTFGGSRKVFFAMLLLTLGLVAWYESRQAQKALAQLREKTAEGESETLSATELDWEYLIDLKGEPSQEALSRLAKAYKFQIRKAFRMQHPEWGHLDEYYLIDLPEGSEEKGPKLEKELYQQGLVDWVEENESIQIHPIEARLPKPRRRDYGLNDPELGRLWSFDLMQVNRLYDFIRLLPVKPRKKALIAILDTGIDGQHEDLKTQYQSIKSEYDRDVREHGTHCAGIAAAVSNNGIGIASLAPSTGYVQVTSVKVLNDYGSGQQNRIIQGILEAADAGADVISLSLGGRSSPSKQKAYEEAVAYAHRAGAIVVVAAGNDNRNARFYAPANVSGVITVAAVDSTGSKASFSNTVQALPYGIAAPGVAIYSTTPNNTYKSFSGTSMATPYVAGLLALMKSYQPDLTTREAWQILHDTGKETADGKYTGRLIQPAAALRQLMGTNN